MVSFCIKFLKKNVDSAELWKRIGRNNLNMIDVNNTVWVHGTLTADEFYNILDECLSAKHLSIEIGRWSDNL